VVTVGANAFVLDHSILLSTSYKRLTGHDLAESGLAGIALPQALFDAPFALVSHGTEPDPIFNYGNRTALTLFEMTWEEFTRLPSRLSAEPVHRDERQRLMDEVTRNGFIADYQGIRVSKNGRRFYIENAIVWNLIDAAGVLRGQAATFANWRNLEGSGAEARG
jgi:hypothetical protein